MPNIPSNGQGTHSSCFPEGNWLYAKLAKDFIEDAMDGKHIASLLKERFISHLLSVPDPREEHSWERSLPVMARVMASAGMRDQLVLLEYCPPSRDRCPSRVDMVICGQDSAGKTHVVLLELKQWSCDFLRRSWKRGYVRVGAGNECVEKEHPRSQVEKYRRHMRKVLEVCDLPPDFLVFEAYAYLHNAHHLSRKAKRILYGKHHDHDLDTRLYTEEFTGALIKRLREHVGAGHGQEAFAALKEVQKRAIHAVKRLPIRRRWPFYKKMYYAFLRRMKRDWFLRWQLSALFLFVVVPLIILIGGVWWVLSR